MKKQQVIIIFVNLSTHLPHNLFHLIITYILMKMVLRQEYQQKVLSWTSETIQTRKTESKKYDEGYVSRIHQKS